MMKDLELRIVSLGYKSLNIHKIGREFLRIGDLLSLFHKWSMNEAWAI